MTKYIAQENIWFNKYKYDDAERVYYETRAKIRRTPLAAEVERAREWLSNIKKSVEDTNNLVSIVTCHPDTQVKDLLENKSIEFEKVISAIQQKLENLLNRVLQLEGIVKPLQELNVEVLKIKQTEDKSSYVDLTASDSEEGIALCGVQKSTGSKVISKSNIIFDVKPWDTDTDFKYLEDEIRKIQVDGLIWGLSRIVPVAYGIHKLQIVCIIEDDKLSVDWLEEAILDIRSCVQSVDIAAFHKI